jgi:hypothetical protein
LSYQNKRNKKILIEQRGRLCESCHNSTWLDNLIPLDLHHLNGDPTDNKLSNLQLLCPNCHALTSNFRGKNKKKAEISDEEIIKTIPKSYSASDCLRRLDKRPQQYLIDRVKLLKETNNLEFLCRYNNESIYQSKKCKICDESTISSKSGLCVKCYKKTSRKISRPPYHKLCKEIEELGYSAVGRIYNVSDNAIRKWKKRYEKEINMCPDKTKSSLTV